MSAFGGQVLIFAYSPRTFRDHPGAWFQLERSLAPGKSASRTSSSQYEMADFALNRNSRTEMSSISLSGLIAAARFPPVDRPLHTWQHLQQETNRCSRGNAFRQLQWDRLAEEEQTPTVLSEGPCLLERNKPPSHSQQESPQQPISRFGISCGTSRCLGRIVSQSSASVRSTADLSRLGGYPVHRDLGDYFRFVDDPLRTNCGFNP